MEILAINGEETNRNYSCTALEIVTYSCFTSLRVHCEKTSWDFEGPPIRPLYIPILSPYHSHFRSPKDMGPIWVPPTIVGGPILGGPR